jgi:hypothetical protein
LKPIVDNGKSVRGGVQTTFSSNGKIIGFTPFNFNQNNDPHRLVDKTCPFFGSSQKYGLHPLLASIPFSAFFFSSRYPSSPHKIGGSTFIICLVSSLCPSSKQGVSKPGPPMFSHFPSIPVIWTAQMFCNFFLPFTE